MRFIERYFFPIVILVIVFYDPLFFAFTTLMNISVESGMKKYEAIAIAVAVYPLFFMDFYRQKTSRYLIQIMFSLLTIILLYYSTSVFHTETPRLYTSQLLVFGAVCIPATYMGTRLAKNDCFEQIDRFLPFLTIPLAIIFSKTGLTSAATNTILGHQESGLNYQNLSYFFAFLYAYNAYYIFFSSIKDTRIYKIMRIPVYIAMVLCVIGCLTSGGRGAFVFVVFISAYIFYYFYKKGEIRINNISYAVIIIIILFIVFASFINITGSAGFARISHNMFVDENRTLLWKKAYHAFLDSPIWGHGLGSIWWTVGYYSHNIITDLLAETGFIGTIIGLIIIWKTVSYIFTLVKTEQKYFFIMFVFFSEFIISLFSGYWISMSNIFFVIAFIYIYKKENTV